MARKIFGGEAVPKIFQTFNSLLGGIVRKRNATIVGPSKQLVGEFPEVDFERLYQYYHHWDQVKTAVSVEYLKISIDMIFPIRSFCHFVRPRIPCHLLR